jgi:hypothetical protein
VSAVTAVTGPADWAQPEQLKWPNQPEPALGSLKKAVFSPSFYPIPYYLGSHPKHDSLTVMVSDSSVHCQVYMPEDEAPMSMAMMLMS